MQRTELLNKLAKHILNIQKPHPTRVAIDGVDGSGKTTLSDELLLILKDKTDRQIIRASIDGFHNPKDIRYRNGKTALSYYKDSFSHQSVIEFLLQPLSNNGTLLYSPAVFDYRTDSTVHIPKQKAAPDAILIMDGVFLLRPELRPFWDLSIFIDVGFDSTIERAVQRDAVDAKVAIGIIRQQYETRYIPGQQLYFQLATPKYYANLIIDNTDFTAPNLLKGL